MDYDLDDGDEMPRKLFDRRQYVRVDGASGMPQLVRLEPIMSEDGLLVSENVTILVDDRVEMIMERGAAEEWIRSTGCVPLAEATNHKQNLRH